MTVSTGRLVAAHGLVDAAGEPIIPAINERGAYGRWIDGYPVWCICGDLLTRTTWTGRRSRLDSLEAPEGRWTHDDGQGGTWDTPAHHVARPLLITDVPWPCASHSLADPLGGGRYRTTPYQPPAGQKAVFGPALTGPFDTRPRWYRRVLDRLRLRRR